MVDTRYTSMASSRGAKAAAAELVLLPSLKNCLVNLPSSLVSVLLNANTIAQNVVVELIYRPQSTVSAAPSTASDGRRQQSVFAGWTGMQSQTKAGLLVGREGMSRSERGDNAKDVPTVELDATFGHLLNLSSGMKVEIKLHLEPPQAHTVNIEPLTATDWEIIELHARFLEMNFLSQVRALPNPAAGHSHPLTLHLTPTSTANITVTSLTPTPATQHAFMKISPDAEVIVAPKTRQQQRQSSARDNRSVTSRQSAGARSGRSVRQRSAQEEEKARPPLFVRAVTRSLRNDDLFDLQIDDMTDEGLKVWVDRDHLLSKTFRGVTWVAVTLIRPAGLQETVDPQQQQQQPQQQPAQKVVARLFSWEDAPSSSHAAISSLLCGALSADGIVGGIVRIEPASTPLPKTASAMKEPSQHASKDAIVKRLRVTPFIPTSTDRNATRATYGSSGSGFRFGGETKAQQEESAAKIRTIFGKSLFEGPLTDGMLLPPQDGWPGGIIDFDPPPPADPSKPRLHWLHGEGRKLDIAVQPETAPIKSTQPPGEPIPDEKPTMVGIDSLLGQLQSGLLHGSSALVTGGLGSGKTCLTQLLAHQLRNEWLYSVTYLSCRTLTSEDTRVKQIKETLHRTFALAAWNARLGGKSLVILDDLDKLCPVEQELQMDANGRSNLVSELLCGLVRQFCARDSGVVLLATAQSKEAVNSIVVGGHVVRDIVALKAPSKEGRRKVLEMLVHQGNGQDAHNRNAQASGVAGQLVNGNAKNEWIEGFDDEERPRSSSSRTNGSRPSITERDSFDGGHANNGDDDSFAVDPDLDLLEIAGQTDGYMPGDLHLLVSRARSEALIRVMSVDDSPLSSLSSSAPTISAVDFAAGLKNFTPASLRNVTLQQSTTTFAAIGGLNETRQTLLETLQYPTTYSPLFSRCPLRLRSGLLLYGFPGCGKTLLASAIAGECNLNFISVKGPEILNKYIGASEKSVRDLFERAEAARPCVLFFDEFDSIAPKRGHDSTGVTDRVVNMLLTMMDGAEGLQGVYVLAATSRPDLIDPALLRPGRLDKSLLCGMPTLKDRQEILRAVSQSLKIEDDEDFAEVAARTDGYSGADLQAVVYNAHLLAIHDLLGGVGGSLGNDEDFGNGGAKSSSRKSTEVPFTYFRPSDFEHASDPASSKPTSGTAQATLAAERAEIASALSSLQLIRRKTKELNRPASSSHQRNQSSSLGRKGETASNTPEPVIKRQHLEKSLAETRSSISKLERQRLERIYREFVVGRSGEMSDGSGSMEVGGRTSLM
ncbi:AAA-domain-containing protein [Polychaeton citri CBS 116435]|uniref:Peroxisomal ATPase PEX1 n=1 Tax=Polychaeton citri CBS 116435 TaxID=1314669 RepID=A0A9P4UUX6_9PEZI|nr:AAA-domain-containing protein [Polychaeton citri CBS 116435]